MEPIGKHLALRKAAGEKEARLFRNIDDPNDITILQKWDTIEKARKCTESSDLKKAMQKAGVTGKPDICFLEEVKIVG